VKGGAVGHGLNELIVTVLTFDQNPSFEAGITGEANVMWETRKRTMGQLGS